MPSLNKVTLMGHLGKAPDIRTFQSGDKVANFTMATSEHWKDKATGKRPSGTV
jgi:single-strand DNA-binding protein